MPIFASDLSSGDISQAIPILLRIGNMNPVQTLSTAAKGNLYIKNVLFQLIRDYVAA